jgi:hypothetical protein
MLVVYEYYFPLYFSLSLFSRDSCIFFVHQSCALHFFFFFFFIFTYKKKKVRGINVILVYVVSDFDK